jgi:hypothetical protein
VAGKGGWRSGGHGRVGVATSVGRNMVRLGTDVAGLGSPYPQRLT